MNEKIIPCPYCGGKTVQVCRTNENACWIQCAECGAESPSAKTRAGAISNWNQRRKVKGYAEIVDDGDAEYMVEEARRKAAKYAA